MHNRIRVTNLVTKYGFTEGSCAITNKAEYMDYHTWAKVEKVSSPGIRKMGAMNVAYALPILFSIYLTTHNCSYRLPTYDT